jgi:hypothetical protein
MDSIYYEASKPDPDGGIAALAYYSWSPTKTAENVLETLDVYVMHTLLVKNFFDEERSLKA